MTTYLQLSFMLWYFVAHLQFMCICHNLELKIINYVPVGTHDTIWNELDGTHDVSDREICSHSVVSLCRNTDGNSNYVNIGAKRFDMKTYYDGLPILWRFRVWMQGYQLVIWIPCIHLKATLRLHQFYVKTTSNLRQMYVNNTIWITR